MIPNQIRAAGRLKKTQMGGFPLHQADPGKGGGGGQCQARGVHSQAQPLSEVMAEEGQG